MRFSGSSLCVVVCCGASRFRRLNLCIYPSLPWLSTHTIAISGLSLQPLRVLARQNRRALHVHLSLPPARSPNPLGLIWPASLVSVNLSCGQHVLPPPACARPLTGATFQPAGVPFAKRCAARAFANHDGVCFICFLCRRKMK